MLATGNNRMRAGVRGIAIAVAYAALVVLRQRFFPLDQIGMTVYPAAGLAVAALITWGWGALWPVALGAAVAAWVTQGAGALALALVAAGVLGPAAGVYLLRRQRQFRVRLLRLADYVRLMLCAGVGGGLVAAVVASGILTALAPDGASGGRFWTVLAQWWMGSLLGVAILTPTLLLLRFKGWRLNTRRWPPGELVLMLGMAFLTGQYVFLGWFDGKAPSGPTGFWMFLFMIWAALRRERQGAALMGTLFTLQALWGMVLGVGFANELWIHQPDLLWRYLLVLNTAGMAIACYVTEQRLRAQKLLRDAITLRDQALEKVQEGVALADPQRRLIYVNEAFERLTGYARDDLLGRTCALLQGPDTDVPTVQAMRERLNAKLPFKGEVLNYRKDGARFWNAVSITPILDRHGEVLEFFGMQSDVSAQKAALHALEQSEERLRMVLKASNDGAWDWDVSTQTAFRSDAWFRMLGYAPDEIPTGRADWPQFVHPDDLDRLGREWDALMAGRDERYAMELRLLHKDGHSVSVLARGYILRDEQGRATRVCGITTDLTAQKEKEARLNLAVAVLLQSREGVVMTDAACNIIMVNKAFTVITGYTEAEVLGQNPRLLASGRHGAAFYQGMWNAILGAGHWEGEIWNRRSDGSVYCEWLAILALRDSHNVATHYVGSFTDLSDAKAAESRIQWLSQFDALTGLPNVTLLRDRAAHSISMVTRSNEPLTLMLLGIDHFKSVNDALGHDAGDALLCIVAQRLKDMVREQDTVARLGGKEFALVLHGTAPDGAAHLASGILRNLARPCAVKGQDLSVTVSIGLASYPDNGPDFDGLFKAAEIAMHRAQQSGRDSFQFYSRTMYEQVLERDQMIKALRGAAAQNQLELVYQPLVDLQTGQISGMEALLRWQHPDLGAVSPVQFIPLAEESGLIKPLGQWVLERACRDIRVWMDKGLKVPHVAVNVSPLQFDDREIIAQVRQALGHAQLSPECLYLEVTESALMKDVRHSEAMLHELKDLGVRLSLDDFGTGYSSLSYLKRFPFDKVKIDQSFVRDITTSQSDIVIVKVIISMAHGLGLRVIAEGVETEAQCEIMRTQVCDEIQGYFFSRPVSAQAIEDLLTEGRQLPPHLLRLRKPQRTLLLVDDEANVLASLKRLLRRDGHQILTASSGAEGLEILGRHKVDVIISDQRMPGMTGVEFLRAAKAQFPDTIRIVLSGYTELQSVTDAINEGAVYRFLTKPWEDEQLREHIKRAFEYKELQEENRQLDLRVRSTNQELVAANRQLGAVLEKTRLQIERDQSSLAIVREALLHLPIPVIGVDDEGRVAMVNEAAERLFPGRPMLGEALNMALPEVAARVGQCAQNAAEPLRVAGGAYLLRWSSMGQQSNSKGRLITLQPQAGNP